MLKGYKTNKLVPLTLTLTGARVKLDARLSFITMPDGQIGLGIHGIRKEPELERPYFGHIFTGDPIHPVSSPLTRIPTNWLPYGRKTYTYQVK